MSFDGGGGGGGRKSVFFLLPPPPGFAIVKFETIFSGYGKQKSQFFFDQILRRFCKFHYVFYFRFLAGDDKENYKTLGNELNFNCYLTMKYLPKEVDKLVCFLWHYGQWMILSEQTEQPNRQTEYDLDVIFSTYSRLLRHTSICKIKCNSDVYISGSAFFFSNQQNPKSRAFLVEISTANFFGFFQIEFCYMMIKEKI